MSTPARSRHPPQREPIPHQRQPIAHGTVSPSGIRVRASSNPENNPAGSSAARPTDAPPTPARSPGRHGRRRHGRSGTPRRRLPQPHVHQLVHRILIGRQQQQPIGHNRYSVTATLPTDWLEKGTPPPNPRRPGAAGPGARPGTGQPGTGSDDRPGTASAGMPQPRAQVDQPGRDPCHTCWRSTTTHPSASRWPMVTTHRSFVRLTSSPPTDGTPGRMNHQVTALHAGVDSPAEASGSWWAPRSSKPV